MKKAPWYTVWVAGVLGYSVMTGCQPAGSHIPEIWALPGAAVSTAIGNAHYQARRTRVADFVQANYTKIQMESHDGGVQPHLHAVAKLASVSDKRYPELVTELREHSTLYFSASANPTKTELEPLVIAIMVHGE